MCACLIVSCESPFHVLECDEGLTNLLEYSANEVVGRSVKLMFGPETDLISINAAIKSTVFLDSTEVFTVLYSRFGTSCAVAIKCCASKLLSGTCRMSLQAINELKDDEKHHHQANMKRMHDKPFTHEVFNRVCIAQNIPGFPTTKKFRCFQPTDLRYFSFCDDFGPYSIAFIASFIKQLDKELVDFPACRVVYCVKDGPRELTNAVFLLGAYMILKMGKSSTEVFNCFRWLEDSQIESFRDATFTDADFGLTLMDCWAGLERGRLLGWIAPPPNDHNWWGQINVGEHRHFDDPLNGDIHEVVPGKFIALRGPLDLPPIDGEPQLYCDGEGFRQFSPAFYVPLLRERGVTDVVRLNESEYDAAGLVDEGMRHHELHFEDCSAPPPQVVEAFLALADATEGLVAVHCKAGLGRTGTLIALYMMREWSFSAREAMGWLRIMRPGSVIGEQQHYLCEMECAWRGWCRDPISRPHAKVAEATPAVLAEQVAAALTRRSSLTKIR